MIPSKHGIRHLILKLNILQRGHICTRIQAAKIRRRIRVIITQRIRPTATTTTTIDDQHPLITNQTITTLRRYRIRLHRMHIQILMVLQIQHVASIRIRPVNRDRRSRFAIPRIRATIELTHRVRQRLNQVIIALNDFLSVTRRAVDIKNGHVLLVAAGTDLDISGRARVAERRVAELHRTR